MNFRKAWNFAEGYFLIKITLLRTILQNEIFLPMRHLRAGVIKSTLVFLHTYAHSSALGKNFPVGDPSSYYHRPNVLNLEVFWDEILRKKMHLNSMSIPWILLKLGLGCHPYRGLIQRLYRRPCSMNTSGTCRSNWVHAIVYCSLCAWRWRIY
jgi:hypothetical protein